MTNSYNAQAPPTSGLEFDVVDESEAGRRTGAIVERVGKDG